MKLRAPSLATALLLTALFIVLNGFFVAAEFAIVKTGRWLGGWATIRLEALDGTRTRLTWREEIVPHPHAIGRLAAPLTDRAVRSIFTRAVAEMAARA